MQVPFREAYCTRYTADAFRTVASCDDAYGKLPTPVAPLGQREEGVLGIQKEGAS